MVKNQLLTNGISKKELDSFAKLPLHNSKKDVFRRIAFVSNFKSLDEFSKSLLEALADKSSDFNLKIPKSQKEYLGDEGCRLNLGGKMAVMMLTQLNIGGYEQYDETLTIDRIYDDAVRSYNKFKNKN